MCQFVSFAVTRTGKILWFPIEERKGRRQWDSHATICSEFSGNNTEEDICGKYEYCPILNKWRVDDNSSVTTSTDRDAKRFITGTLIPMRMKLGKYWLKKHPKVDTLILEDTPLELIPSRNELRHINYDNNCLKPKPLFTLNKKIKVGDFVLDYYRRKYKVLELVKEKQWNDKVEIKYRCLYIKGNYENTFYKNSLYPCPKGRRIRKVIFKKLDKKED